MTNPLRLELEDPKAYQRKLQQLVGERDPLDVLAETPAILARIVRQHDAATLRTRPFENKWTPNEILGHLVDTEWTFGYRMRTIYGDDEPTIVGMDQDGWATRQKHNEREPEEHLDQFTHLRRFNVAFWKRVPAAELTRIGRHSERGPESLALMLKLEAGHDLSHLDQLDRYLKAVVANKEST